MTLPLRVRLAVISTTIFGLLLATVAVASYRLLAQGLDGDVSARLNQLTDGLHGYLRYDADIPYVAFNAADSAQTDFVQEATRYYQVYDASSGQLLSRSPGLAPLGLRLSPGDVRALRARPVPFDFTTGAGRYRVSNSLVWGTNGRPYLLQVGVPLSPMDATLGRFRTLLLWRLPLALLLAGLSAWGLSALALTPLSRAAAAARAIDVTTLSQRIPQRGTGDELDDVAQAFNDTLSRLEHAVAEMRQFSAALAHELRTPLAALRGEIELALRRSGPDEEQQRTLASQIEEIDRLHRLIDRILMLARAEAGQIPLTFAAVNLAEMAGSLVEQLEPIAQARSIELRCEGEPGVLVSGDAGWLQRLILNLLDNAIKFSAAGGHVTLRVSRAADVASIAVQDDGAGLSPDDARRVFERFFRADPSRSSRTQGAGLGLSLVQWIAERHHGTVAVESRLGEGSTFTVTLPALPA